MSIPAGLAREPESGHLRLIRMEDPQALRECARWWRERARFHDPSAAIALVAAARELEARADGIERAQARRGPLPGLAGAKPA